MTIIQVPITKGKGFLEVDTEKDIPDDVYGEALLQGLKVLLNRGASKVTAASISDEEARKAEAMKIAQVQLELVRTSKIKFTGGKAKKASGKVMTEARRLAKNLVKDQMREAGLKLSHFEAAEITKAANALLDEMPELIEQAKANLAERDKVKISDKIDIKSLIKASPKLVAKAEADKAAKRSQLSKTQAGKVQARAKGQPAAPATH